MKHLFLILGMVCLFFREQAAPPDWQYNESDYQYTATFTGVIELDGLPAGDPSDQLAAFVGDELRGVSYPVYIEGKERYYIFLTVSSNEVSGETITFKYYQAATDRVINLYNTETFDNDQIEGSINEPVVFTNELPEQVFNIEENSEEGMYIGRVVYEDLERQDRTFEFISGNEGEPFSLVPDRGYLYVNNSELLDYETTPEFRLVLSVTDGMETKELAVAVVLENVKENTTLEIFPNPSNSVINLNINKDADKEVLSVNTFASDGSRIYLEPLNKGDARKMIFSVQHLRAGVYYIVVETTKGTYGIRFIKVK